MNDNSVQLILHAGEAQSLALEAVSAAKEGDFSSAERLLKEAENEQIQAHKCQTEMLCSEASGLTSSPTMLVMHAQDHVTSGNLLIIMAKELISVYKKLSKQEEKV